MREQELRKGGRPSARRPRGRRAEDQVAAKTMTAAEAVKAIKSGQHVLIGSGAAEPAALVEALAARRDELFDVEALHLLTLGPAPYAAPEFAGHIRHNALFIGPNVRSAVRGGLADYTPCFLCEVPELIRSGRLRVDAALIQVSPPEHGTCTLGVSVDILKAAVEKASYVVAQVNAGMPRTRGLTTVLVEDIDAFVFQDAPLPELAAAPASPAALWIGRYVSSLVEDGSTIQAGIGAVPDAVLSALSGKKDLGIHSEMLSDGMLDLMERGVVTGRRKSIHAGKAVASFCLGSRRLYEAASSDPAVELYPVDYVNDPCIIAENERMVSINSALQVDLTGQVAADAVEGSFYSGVGGQVDFIRGAARSPGGKSIIAMQATAQEGAVSRITARLEAGAGVVTTRADVDCVVTEYGIAELKGRSIRERAVALIQAAHPRFRQALLEEAKALGYVDAGHVLPSPESGRYLVDLECRRAFDGLETLIRPLKASDERALKDLFYSQSRETTLMRFGMPLKRLTERQFQELVAIDFVNSAAIGAFAGERLIAVARYSVDPGSRAAEAAVTVHDEFQGKGLGTFLMSYLAWIAREQELEALRVEVLSVNLKMRRMLDRCFTKVTETDMGPDGVAITARLSDWKGRGNPAEA